MRQPFPADLELVATLEGNVALADDSQDEILYKHLIPEDLAYLAWGAAVWHDCPKDRTYKGRREARLLKRCV